MNPAVISFFIYTAILVAIGIWSYRIVEKVPITKYEKEFYAAGRGLGGVIVAMIIAPEDSPQQEPSLPGQECAMHTVIPGS